MKSSIFLFCLICLKFSDALIISDAISDVVNTLKDTRLDLIVSCDDCVKLNDIAEDILKRSLKNNPVKIIKLGGDKLWDYKLHQSAILLFNNFKELKNFNRQIILSNDYAKDLKFLVHCLKFSSSDLLEIDETDKKLSILRFQTFLIDKVVNYTLETFVWFTKDACFKPQLIISNTYSKQRSEWTLKDFFPIKFHDFFGCELVIGALHQAPAFGYEIVNNTISNVFGYNALIIQNIAEHLNFTITYNPFMEHCQCFLNTTLNNHYFMKSENLQHISEGNVFITETYFETKSTFMVPAGQLYSDFEKLFFPFSLETWIGIIIVYFTAILVIVALNFSTQKGRNFCIGKQVKTPTLNLIIHTFGGNQTVLPRRNFARFILMVHMLFCLIMRTGYQAKNFEMLQTEMRRNPVRTINEMIERNFTFYVFPGFLKFFSGMDLLQRARFVEMNFTDLFGPFAEERVRQPNFQGGFLLNTQFIAVQSTATKGLYKNYFLNENFFISQYGLSFSKNHFLYDIVSRKIMQLKTAGIADHWTLPWLKSRYSTEIVPDKGPKVLTLKHLGIGFKVCFCMLLLSSLVFIFEVVIHKVLKLITRKLRIV